MRAQRPQPTLYDSDFYEWTKAQARALAEGRLDALDRANLAEEIESLGKSDRREVESRLQVILVHLLKQRFQPEKATPSWEATIVEQRDSLERVLRDSPSLHLHVAEALPAEYARARRRAARETGLDAGAFPAACPFGLAEVLPEGED